MKNSAIFHRQLNQTLPLAVSGHGCYIVDDKGNEYIDASGGAAVSNLGHGNEAVRKALHEQIDKLAYAHTTFFTSEPSEKLASFLTARAPGNMAAAYFVSSGSEAVETSLKMARQYFLEIGQPQRQYFIGRSQSYHGNTLGALSVGGNAWRRAPFEPLLVEHGRVSPCYPYRNQKEDETDEKYGDRLAAELEGEIKRLGGDTVIAFVAETVCGATLGAQAAVPGYFKKVREVCDRYGILLILDEVMCGMGRTGSLFAYEQEGVIPDLVTLAKGLAGGYQPLGAVLISAEIKAAFEQSGSAFKNGHTYLGHPLACTAALAVQQQIEELNLVPQVAQLGEFLKAELNTQFSGHPNIGDIRGRGLFVAVELVADKASKAPLNSSLKTAEKIRQIAMSHGLACYPGNGTIDGKNGDHILLAPPFIANEALIVEIVRKLKVSVDQALNDE